MTTVLDHPYEEVLENASSKVKEGWTIFQKWTCQKCRSRCTAATPNHFTPLVVCTDCGTITDVRATGCNFMASILIGGEDEK